MTDVVLTDIEARKRALFDHGATLMLEAAAGTGKTALIAGRITMMLASGIAPGRIAAVTFGEYAASELSTRVGEYVADFLAGRTPKAMRSVLDAPLSEEQQTNLKRARTALDELTCSTIHAFCQILLTAHAIDANVDPGARVIDEREREAVLDLAFDAWLERRLSGPSRADDPIAHLAQHNPHGVVAELKRISMIRLEHREAAAPQPDIEARPDRLFAESVTAFRAWYETCPREPRTAAVLADLEKLVEFFGTPFETAPSFERLWALSDPPLLAISAEDSDGVSRDLVAPALDYAWRDVAAAKDASALNDEYKRRFQEAREHYACLVNHIAAWALWRISGELDELINAYQEHKRRAAMLDFTDLLCFARDLVRDNDTVRAVIAGRYQHILVDEFQDTDPVQAELLFRIAADVTEERDAHWSERRSRPGALFMVGDPKQAIYGFRGGDVVSYRRVRRAIEASWPGNVLQLTNNFRSRPAIIEHVNTCFVTPFGADAQPDYVRLEATLSAAAHGLPAAARLEIGVRGANAVRDEEAKQVAAVCKRLIGAYPVGDRMLRAGDIALLTPQGTELGRYEQALQAEGIPFVSQAGKSLMKRQETQDFLALARVLANRRDYVAFGALMRGPLVGLTEVEILDIAAELPDDPRHPRLCMFSEASRISHDMARKVLETLQELSAKARRTTPLLILSEALERLLVRPMLAERREARGERAWANIEALLERSRPYGVAGLRHFARDFGRDWQAGALAAEGRLDADGDALEIMTMHAAKGLQWPVVIPINAVTERKRQAKYVYRPEDNTLHWIIGGVRAPELAATLSTAEDEQTWESIRLWYVACTRAEELLVVPKLEKARGLSWAALVDLKHARLPPWDMAWLEPAVLPAADEKPNTQAADTFNEQQEAIAAKAQPVRWRVPSDADFDRAPILEEMANDIADAPMTPTIIGAGRFRGLVLHKLMEEVLNGETPDDGEALEARARTLTGELAAQSEAIPTLPDANEMAGAVLRTLALPDVAKARARLVPEWSVYAELGPHELLAGRADAIAYDASGRAEIVFDWKSDINPTEAVIAEHASQLTAYLTATGAPRGALVYMSKGLIRWTAR